ncbi:hypothetical protein Ciccas_004115 [Cichlidogyrus casuarinus]|uniref:Uncharacterized protein n=1 Tax=Cichlidogyrus casuarinus TaxID=1844966 RepID=A0ABD2QCF9_9PLAT
MMKFILCILALIPLVVVGQDCSDAATVVRNLVFDAGSTSTKAYLVTVEGPASNMKLKAFVKFNKIDLALSSISGASQFPQLRSTFQNAISQALSDTTNIPITCRKETGIVLLATAGLRAISAALSNLILQEVTRIFLLSELKPISPIAEILSGFDEGLYYWLSVNFLGKTFETGDPTKTEGILEMGGGSVQVVAALPANKAAELEKVTGQSAPLLSILGKPYYVYSYSYLNGGIQAARFNFFFQNNEGFCIKDGASVNYNFNGVNRVFTGVSIFNGARYEACRNLGLQVVNSINVKSFNALLDGIPFIGGSLFYYNAHALHSLANNCDLGGATLPCDLFVHPMTLFSIKSSARKYCQNADLPENNPLPPNVVYLCQDLVYIEALLEDGWKFTNPRFNYTTRLTIDGHELSWVLGRGLQFGFDRLNSSATRCFNPVFAILSLAMVNMFRSHQISK